jgi:hypothetical protein
MVAISAAEVASEGDRDLSVACVVGRVQHEFAHGLEMALDSIQMAGKGGCCHQLDLVRRGPLTDLPSPVQEEIVVDEINPQMIGVAGWTYLTRLARSETLESEAEHPLG